MMVVIFFCLYHPACKPLEAVMQGIPTKLLGDRNFHLSMVPWPRDLLKNGALTTDLSGFRDLGVPASTPTARIQGMRILALVGRGGCLGCPTRGSFSRIGRHFDSGQRWEVCKGIARRGPVVIRLYTYISDACSCAETRTTPTRYQKQPRP
ncbi:hypothetical protein VTI74DRAFT_8246 [Chaetomium olivicolor]